MKFFIVFAAVLAVAFAQDKEAIVTNSNVEVNPDGSYQYAYGTSNGINAQETGVGGVNADGSASWTAPDGTPVQFSYTADENGYHPAGDILPTPPPTPIAIVKLLEYLAAHPPAPERK